MQNFLLILTLGLQVNVSVFGYGKAGSYAEKLQHGNGGNLQFYYHSNHLGSSNYVTDANDNIYQHYEYFP